MSISTDGAKRIVEAILNLRQALDDHGIHGTERDQLIRAAMPAIVAQA